MINMMNIKPLNLSSEVEESVVALGPSIFASVVDTCDVLLTIPKIGKL